MKRRAFLQTGAASVAAVFTPGVIRGRAASVKPPPNRQPRWKWEVGEWMVSRKNGKSQYAAATREWKARVDALPVEVQRLSESFGYTNDEPFCGIARGHVAMLSLNRSSHMKDGLVLCGVVMEERECERRTYQDGPFICVCRDEPTNFNDLFRGGNVVSPYLSLSRR